MKNWIDMTPDAMQLLILRPVTDDGCVLECTGIRDTEEHFEIFHSLVPVMRNSPALCAVAESECITQDEYMDEKDWQEYAAAFWFECETAGSMTPLTKTDTFETAQKIVSELFEYRNWPIENSEKAMPVSWKNLSEKTKYEIENREAWTDRVRIYKESDEKTYLKLPENLPLSTPEDIWQLRNWLDEYHPDADGLVCIKKYANPASGLRIYDTFNGFDKKTILIIGSANLTEKTWEELREIESPLRQILSAGDVIHEGERQILVTDAYVPELAEKGYRDLAYVLEQAEKDRIDTILVKESHRRTDVNPLLPVWQI